jgi:hypothetical protein
MRIEVDIYVSSIPLDKVEAMSRLMVSPTSYRTAIVGDVGKRIMCVAVNLTDV